MATIKITKKHHKHLNNPFPSSPKSLPVLQGNLFFNSRKLPSEQIFRVGNDFQLTWSSNNGGVLSLSHHSLPSRSLWSTIPGHAFVSAASVDTEVEESRGSFVIHDRDVHFVCNHQIIEDIRVINLKGPHLDPKDGNFLSGYEETDQNDCSKDTQMPVLLITGWIFSSKNKTKKRNKRVEDSNYDEKLQFESKGFSTSARYYILFDQKNSNQVGFQVQIGQPEFVPCSKGTASPVTSGRFQGVNWKLGKRKLGWYWYLTRRNGIMPSPVEKEKFVSVESREFNRICFTYSSERNEKFFGFGEQFSHMDFKGRRVPIFVQEQGIGRGDQPITLAANLVSYRYIK